MIDFLLKIIDCHRSLLERQLLSSSLELCLLHLSVVLKLAKVGVESVILVRKGSLLCYKLRLVGHTLLSAELRLQQLVLDVGLLVCHLLYLLSFLRLAQTRHVVVCSM